MFFFFNDTATTEIYTLSLHDALPIWPPPARAGDRIRRGALARRQAPRLRDGRQTRDDLDRRHRRARPPPPDVRARGPLPRLVAGRKGVRLSTRCRRRERSDCRSAAVQEATRARTR